MLKEGVIVPVDKRLICVHRLRPYSNQMEKCICAWTTRNSTKLSRDRIHNTTTRQHLHIAQRITFYITLCAISGYWQMPLDTALSELTTFITESGRYRFTRLPFRISLASEIYQHEMVKVLHGTLWCGGLPG